MTFSATGTDNCVVVAGTAFVYATVDRRGFVMRAQCPHRGGPLHLAEVTADGSSLECPWHGRRTRLARLRAQIPAVRNGDRVTAVIPDTAAALPEPDASVSQCPVSFEYRPLSPQLARPQRAG